MRRPPQLTQREGEIVPFLASGFSRAEIAQHLDVSEETVKKHTSNILAKFDSLTLREAFFALKNYAEYYALPSPHIRSSTGRWSLILLWTPMPMKCALK